MSNKPLAGGGPYYDQFAEAWRNRRSLVGDPQTATDQRPRGIFDPRLQRGSETSVPPRPFQPNPPHSQPPAGERPKPQPPRELPPGAQPAPPPPTPRR